MFSSTPLVPECQNGGYFDGFNCICSGNYAGPQCEYLTIGCENGGYKIGSECVCNAGFNGPTCQYADSTLSVGSVDVIIKINVRIINMDYTDALKDENSVEYRNFVRRFNIQMKVIYKSSLSKLKAIKIIQIRPGSVIVDHEVIMETAFVPNITNVYDEIYSQVENELRSSQPSLDTCNNSTFLCFDPAATTFAKGNFPTVTEMCSHIVSAGLTEYYFPYYNGTTLQCITNCTMGLSTSFDCNYGECRVLAKSGPQCLCTDTNDFWYSGRYCDTRISRPGVIGGVTATLIVLIIVIVIVVIIYRRRRGAFAFKNNMSKYLDSDGMESEWSVSSEDSFRSPGVAGYSGFISGIYRPITPDN
ncbi:mucin-3A-like [Pelobates fuscus]|uniref:mucin-3A-like n=1 Tax=Pelobates fuscus TaxID=191477 RepID=UPI002FE43265